MWVTVKLLEDVPEVIGLWYPARKRGDVTDYPDLLAAQLVADGKAELVDASDELREYLANLMTEDRLNVEEQVEIVRDERGLSNVC
jgi:hypothetical protein